MVDGKTGRAQRGQQCRPPAFVPLSLRQLVSIVVQGRKNVGGGNEKVMPSFGENRNVMCYVDDIYVYLRARANDAVGRGRPAKHEDKSPAYQQAEDSCMGKR